MSKWKTIFVFLTGFFLMHLIGHIWMTFEGMLPFSSRLIELTITPETNAVIIILNAVVVFITGYLGFFHIWHAEVRLHRPA